jgi:hypothetical protein
MAKTSPQDDPSPQQYRCCCLHVRDDGFDTRRTSISSRQIQRKSCREMFRWKSSVTACSSVAKCRGTNRRATSVYDGSTTTPRLLSDRLGVGFTTFVRGIKWRTPRPMLLWTLVAVSKLCIPPPDQSGRNSPCYSPVISIAGGPSCNVVV